MYKTSTLAIMVKLQVSNIDASVNKHQLERLFEEYGIVGAVKIFRKPGSGTAIGFVEMEEEHEAIDAITALDKRDFMGSKLRVEYPHDRVQTAKPDLKPLTAMDLEEEDEDEEDEMISEAEEARNFVDPEAEEEQEVEAKKQELLGRRSDQNE